MSMVDKSSEIILNSSGTGSNSLRGTSNTAVSSARIASNSLSAKTTGANTKTSSSSSSSNSLSAKTTGANTKTPNLMTALYGTPTVSPTTPGTGAGDRMIALYGTPSVSPTTPGTGADDRMIALYGTPSVSPSTPISNPSINITYNELEQNISTLKSTISTLKSTWDQEIKNNLNTISGSWAGKDCEVYTSKLSNMDGRVQNTIQSLELLCSTYEKARDMVSSSQTQAKSDIESI